MVVSSYVQLYRYNHRYTDRLLIVKEAIIWNVNRSLMKMQVMRLGNIFVIL